MEINLELRSALQQIVAATDADRRELAELFATVGKTLLTTRVACPRPAEAAQLAGHVAGLTVFADPLTAHELLGTITTDDVPFADVARRAQKSGEPLVCIAPLANGDIVALGIPDWLVEAVARGLTPRMPAVVQLDDTNDRTVEPIPHPDPKIIAVATEIGNAFAEVDVIHLALIGGTNEPARLFIVVGGALDLGDPRDEPTFDEIGNRFSHVIPSQFGLMSETRIVELLDQVGFPVFDRYAARRPATLDEFDARVAVLREQHSFIDSGPIASRRAELAELRIAWSDRPGRLDRNLASAIAIDARLRSDEVLAPEVLDALQASRSAYRADVANLETLYGRDAVAFELPTMPATVQLPTEITHGSWRSAIAVLDAGFGRPQSFVCHRIGDQLHVVHAGSLEIAGPDLLTDYATATQLAILDAFPRSSLPPSRITLVPTDGGLCDSADALIIALAGRDAFRATRADVERIVQDVIQNSAPTATPGAAVVAYASTRNGTPTGAAPPVPDARPSTAAGALPFAFGTVPVFSTVGDLTDELTPGTFAVITQLTLGEGEAFIVECTAQAELVIADVARGYVGGVEVVTRALEERALQTPQPLHATVGAAFALDAPCEVIIPAPGRSIDPMAFITYERARAALQSDTAGATRDAALADPWLTGLAVTAGGSHHCPLREVSAMVLAGGPGCAYEVIHPESHSPAIMVNLHGIPTLMDKAIQIAFDGDTEVRARRRAIGHAPNRGIDLDLNR